MSSLSVWIRNAAVGALLMSPYAIIGPLSGTDSAIPALTATVSGGAAGGLLYTALHRLRLTGPVGYYSAWILAISLTLGVFLLALHALMQDSPDGTALDLFREPEGVLLFLGSGFAIGIFMGRWFRRMSRGDLR